MFLKEKYWYRLFEASVALKAINGLWETISGFALLFLTKARITSSFILASRAELSEDPQDKLINFLNTQLSHLSNNSKNFAAVYILVHGLMNLFLAYNLRKNRLWAYVVSIIFSCVAIVYSAYRASHTHSAVLIGLIIFEAFFIMLTWHEYKYNKNKGLKNKAISPN